MRIQRLLVLFTLILVTGCGTSTPAPTQTPLPTQPPAPTPTPLPTPTLTSVPTATPSVAMLIDDFEAAEAAWQAGTEPMFSDSSSVRVALTTEHASQGMQALQLDFENNDKPKAIFYLDGQFDFSQARTLRFDFFNPGTVSGVGISVTTGPDAVWHESASYPVGAGKTTSLVFDLTASNYKAASTNWEFRASIADLNSVSRLAIIIYPAQSESAYLDNVYLSNTP